MAQNDAATLLVATAQYFVANPGTALPEDVTKPGAGWTEIGHTIQGEVMTWEVEGNDPEPLGSLQKSNIRTKPVKRTFRFGVKSLEWSDAGLKLYFGANTTVGSKGEIQVMAEGRATDKAFLAVLYDGERKAYIYAAAADIIGKDAPELQAEEGFSALPLTVTPKEHGANRHVFAVKAVG